MIKTFFLLLKIKQSKRYESALAGNPPGATVSQSSSSAKLSDLDAPLLSHPSALSLIQLVMWITDIRYILSQLQDVWSCAWKQLGTICPKNKNILESMKNYSCCFVTLVFKIYILKLSLLDFKVLSNALFRALKICCRR